MKTDIYRRIFGVIDLRGGKAVRAFAGHRDKYLPVPLSHWPDRYFASPSQRHDGDALAILEAFLERGVGGTYIADLDSICDRSDSSLPIISTLFQRPGEFWIDLGISGECSAELARIRRLIRVRRRFVEGVDAVGPCRRYDGESWWPDPVWVVPTESIRDLSTLSQWLASARQEGEAEEALKADSDDPFEESDRVLPKFAAGLDLRDGKVVSACEDLVHSTPLEAAQKLVGLGFQRLCIIDIADVGRAVGARTEELCRQLRQANPDLVMIGGGGGRGVSDFQHWWEAGCDAVLSATWLLRQIEGFSADFSH